MGRGRPDHLPGLDPKPSGEIAKGGLSCKGTPERPLKHRFQFRQLLPKETCPGQTRRLGPATLSSWVGVVIKKFPVLGEGQVGEGVHLCRRGTPPSCWWVVGSPTIPPAKAFPALPRRGSRNGWISLKSWGGAAWWQRKEIQCFAHMSCAWDKTGWRPWRADMQCR